MARIFNMIKSIPMHGTMSSKLQGGDIRLISPESKYRAKVVIAIDNLAKTYAVADSGSCIDKGSSVGHTFVGIFDQDNVNIDLFEHGPGKLRSNQTRRVESLPIPSRFGYAKIDVIEKNGHHNVIPKTVFDYIYDDGKIIKGDIIIQDRAARKGETIENLIRDAIQHDKVLGFCFPIKDYQYNILKKLRIELEKIGYDPRDHNCASYTRALFKSFLTKKGREKVSSITYGPHLLYDVEDFNRLSNIYYSLYGETFNIGSYRFCNENGLREFFGIYKSVAPKFYNEPDIWDNDLGV